MASLYAGRWSIEDTFRATKQTLRGEDPQSWKYQGPERVVALSLWLHATVWAWYLATHGATPTWTPRPWYRTKATPSFADALSCLRRTLWAARISAASADVGLPQQISSALIDLLADAADQPPAPLAKAPDVRKSTVRCMLFVPGPTGSSTEGRYS